MSKKIDLHTEIMNIRIDKNKMGGSIGLKNKEVIYKEGHRDVRHGAAELPLKAEMYTTKLEEKLRVAEKTIKSIKSFFPCVEGDYDVKSLSNVIVKLSDKALNQIKGE